ncbi:MAG TPA: alcohol dehydrogenase catalytic domain-containing protein [Solirubrobacteraceae bacterium]|nr:alcohol dehydrogenase catalytic domain-containing protein [Solirubrobacteraceae bacterium]
MLGRFREPPAVTEVDLAEPKAGALVRLVACEVCHTEMYTASGVDPSGWAPTVLGHEGAGVADAVGPRMSSLTIGDHVVTLFSPQCGECVHRRDRCRCVHLAPHHWRSHRLPDDRAGPEPGGRESLAWQLRSPGRALPGRGEPAEPLPWGPDYDGRTRLGCVLHRASAGTARDVKRLDAK